MLKEEILEKISEADKVLIGIGKEWEYSFADELAEYGTEKETEGYIKHYIVKNSCTKGVLKLKEAYKVIENLIKDKDSFIISLTCDDVIKESFDNSTRIVTPCGGYRKMQCENGCEIENGKAIVDTDLIASNIMELVANGKTIEMNDCPVCPKCGKKLVFNNKSVENYIEEDYLKQFEEYKKWLQSTVNRKLVILELGCNMMYPGVIRFPFEKLVFYNQKSHLYRVHESLFQVPKEVSERATKIQSNSIDFINSLN